MPKYSVKHNHASKSARTTPTRADADYVAAAMAYARATAHSSNSHVYSLDSVITPNIIADESEARKQQTETRENNARRWPQQRAFGSLLDLSLLLVALVLNSLKDRGARAGSIAAYQHLQLYRL